MDTDSESPNSKMPSPAAAEDTSLEALDLADPAEPDPRDEDEDYVDEDDDYLDDDQDGDQQDGAARAAGDQAYADETETGSHDELADLPMHGEELGDLPLNAAQEADPAVVLAAARALPEPARRRPAPFRPTSLLPRGLRLGSWRYFKTTVALTLVAGVFLLAAAPLASRDYRTNLEISRIRKSADSAQRKLATAAPAEERKLRPLLAEAERLTLAEKVGGSGYRGRPAAEAWGVALLQARTAVAQVRKNENEATVRWKELSPKAKLAVEKSRQLVATTPGMARSSTRNLERAQAQWATAQSFAAKGRYDQAVAAAEVVLEATGQVQERWDHIHDRFDEPGLLRQWRNWTDATVSESNQRTTVLIDKLNRRMTVYKDGKAIATFHVELGSRGLERKLHAGDKATPEGRYKVVAVKDHGQSKYYRAFLLNYPNGEDIDRFRSAKKNGQVPVRAGIGSLIEIHGSGGQGKDWTDGCIALRDQEMDRLFRWVGHGTPVTIVGTVPEGRRGS